MWGSQKRPSLLRQALDHELSGNSDYINTKKSKNRASKDGVGARKKLKFSLPGPCLNAKPKHRALRPARSDSARRLRERNIKNPLDAWPTIDDQPVAKALHTPDHGEVPGYLRVVRVAPLSPEDGLPNGLSFVKTEKRRPAKRIQSANAKKSEKGKGGRTGNKLSARRRRQTFSMVSREQWKRISSIINEVDEEEKKECAKSPSDDSKPESAGKDAKGGDKKAASIGLDAHARHVMSPIPPATAPLFIDGGGNTAHPSTNEDQKHGADKRLGTKKRSSTLKPAQQSNPPATAPVFIDGGGNTTHSRDDGTISAGVVIKANKRETAGKAPHEKKHSHTDGGPSPPVPKAAKSPGRGKGGELSSEDLNVATSDENKKEEKDHSSDEGTDDEEEGVKLRLPIVPPLDVPASPHQKSADISTEEENREKDGDDDDDGDAEAKDNDDTLGGNLRPKSSPAKLLGKTFALLEVAAPSKLSAEEKEKSSPIKEKHERKVALLSHETKPKLRNRAKHLFPQRKKEGWVYWKGVENDDNKDNIAYSEVPWWKKMRPYAFDQDGRFWKPISEYDSNYTRKSLQAKRFHPSV
eukprot:jgi/Bigna1/131076/aug1.13_g5784